MSRSTGYHATIPAPSPKSAERSRVNTVRFSERRELQASDDDESERAKYVLHQLLAAMLLVLMSPLLGLLIVLVRLTSRGPAIYRQSRVGIRGRIFTMYKIRTMCCDAERATGPVWAAISDPRATRIGQFLRWSHLDELPQLVNVVRGEMALVGPRPERPEFTRALSLRIPEYVKRLQVRPGITGLAQINLCADADENTVRRKLMLDLKYIENPSLSIDVRIMIATAMSPLQLVASATRRLMGIFYAPSELVSICEQVHVSPAEHS